MVTEQDSRTLTRLERVVLHLQLSQNPFAENLHLAATELNHRRALTLEALNEIDPILHAMNEIDTELGKQRERATLGTSDISLTDLLLEQKSTLVRQYDDNHLRVRQRHEEECTCILKINALIEEIKTDLLRERSR